MSKTNKRVALWAKRVALDLGRMKDSVHERERHMRQRCEETMAWCRGVLEKELEQGDTEEYRETVDELKARVEAEDLPALYCDLRWRMTYRVATIRAVIEALDPASNPRLKNADPT